MPKRKRGLTTDEIQKVLADLEHEIFDDSDSDWELENEEDDLISAQQKLKIVGLSILTEQLQERNKLL
ncbi:hypothetical protein TNCV_1716381 [Trichonephila clavipes]|nr:hypothetical protein TNCV_1716381 [Trichonephila clavipes]